MSLHNPQDAWISEGCGLEWRISANAAFFWDATYAFASKADQKHMNPVWRGQEACGEEGNWQIGHPAEGGFVDLKYFPKASSDDPMKCRLSELSGVVVGRFQSEAEARLGVACYEYFSSQDTAMDSYLAHAGYQEVGGHPGQPRVFVKEMQGGKLTVDLNEVSLRRGRGRSVEVIWTQEPSGGWNSLIRLEDVQPQPGKDDRTIDGTMLSTTDPVRRTVESHDPFLADVIAAVTVAEARLQLRGPGKGMLRALETGEEVSEIARIIADCHSAAGQNPVL